MIGLDTNVLLRFYFNDDPAQSPQAREVVNRLTAAQPGWVGITNILELVWVMESRKGADRETVAGLLEGLLAEDIVVVERAEVIAKAVQMFRGTKADFADCVIAASARAAGCKRTVTFDRIAARDLGMELLEQA